MAHPSEVYLRFLIAQGIGTGDPETLETLNSALDVLRLPSLADEEFDRLLAQVEPDFKVQWHNPRHEQTANWLKELGCFSFWNMGEDEKLVFELHFRPQVREIVEILLMGRISPEDIAVRIQRRFKLEITPEAIEAYQHYFWNVEGCSVSEWFRHLSVYSVRDHYMAALTGSKNQALWRAGFNPKVDPQRALKEAHLAIVMRLDALRTAPDTKETAEMYTKYSKELRDIHQIIFGEGSQMEEQLKELRRFRMEKHQNKPTSLRLVASNGSFSDDGSDDE